MNTFKPTKQQLRRAWHYYNAVVFEGVLRNTPKFTLNKKKKVYADGTQSVDGSSHWMGFSKYNCKIVEDYIDALLHEMVHQWQYETFGNDHFVDDNYGHGACFKIWRDQVRKVYPSEDYDDDE